jgi:uncharacterized protein
MARINSIDSIRESRFKAFVRRNPLASMYGLMFLLAWPFLILEALGSHELVPKPPALLGFATGWAPGIAAVVVTVMIAGGSGVRDLFGRFLIWRVSLIWYLVAFLMIAMIILGGIGLHLLFGGATPVIPAVGASILNIALAFVILIVAGALINTEEIAWRGFALPRLQARYSPLTASLLLALPEAAFHLPYFWNKDSGFYQNVGIFWFTAFTLAAVFIYVFVFNKTKGSLLIVTLLHASQNAWANLLSDNTLRPFQFTVALMWVIAIALIFLTKGRLGYKPE